MKETMNKQAFAFISLPLFAIACLAIDAHLSLYTGLLLGVSLINASGFQRGVAQDETGINIEEIVIVTAPEYKEPLLDKVGEIRGWAVAAIQRTVTVRGEVSGSTGLMAATFTATASLSNSTSYFGGSSGGLYLNTATVTENRSGWKTVEQEYQANAGVS